MHIFAVDLAKEDYDMVGKAHTHERHLLEPVPIIDKHHICKTLIYYGFHPLFSNC